MLVFDSHVHIETGIVKPVTIGLNGYDLEVYARNFICNFPELLNDYVEYKTDRDTLCYIFNFRDDSEIKNINSHIKSNKIQGLKIHSRIQKIKRDEYDIISKKLKLIDEGIPVILDAWYYGSELKHNPDIEGLIQIAKSDPERQFIIAHAGGYRIIEYFYHTREVENISFDISLTTQYLQDSSLFMDLKKFIKWIGSDRILFGSDYPYASPKLQFDLISDILSGTGKTLDDKEKIFFENGRRIYGKG